MRVLHAGVLTVLVLLSGGLAATALGDAACDQGHCESGPRSFNETTNSFKIPVKLIAQAAAMFFGGSVPFGASLCIPDVTITLAKTLGGEPWVACGAGCCDPETTLTMVAYADFAGVTTGGPFSNSNPVTTTVPVEVCQTSDGGQGDLDDLPCRVQSRFLLKTGSVGITLTFTGGASLSLTDTSSVTASGIIGPRITSSCGASPNNPPSLSVPAGVVQGTIDEWFEVLIEASDVDSGDLLRVVPYGTDGARVEYVTRDGFQWIRILAPESTFVPGQILEIVVEAYDLLPGISPSDAELIASVGSGYARHYVREAFQVELTGASPMQVPNVSLSYPASAPWQEYTFYVESPDVVIDSTQPDSRHLPSFVAFRPVSPLMGVTPCCRQAVVLEIRPCEAPVGRHRFTYQTRNVAGLVSSGTVTIDILPVDAPVAVADTFDFRNRDTGTPAGECRIRCPVLDNDAGGRVVATLVSEPKYGTVEVHASDPVFIYTPDPKHDYLAEPDTFTYKTCLANRPEMCSAPATVTVQHPCITSQAPTADTIWLRVNPGVRSVPDGVPVVLVDPVVLAASDADSTHNPADYTFAIAQSGTAGLAGRMSPLFFDGVGLDDSRTATECDGMRILKGNVVLQADRALAASRYEFEYKVTDSDFLSGTGWIVIEVQNGAPIGDRQKRVSIPFNNLRPLMYPLDPAWYEAGCLTFTDPNGDPLSLRLGKYPTKGQVDLTSAGSSGRYSVTLLYTVNRGEVLKAHRGTEPYIDRFTVVAEDPFGATAETQVEVTVSVANTPPTCVEDSATTPSNAAIDIAVLANDSDPDQDVLTIVAVTAPVHGTAAIKAGRVTYTPQAGFCGQDSFTYAVFDGYGGTATAQVTIEVVDTEPPVFTWSPPPMRPLGNDAGLCGAVVTWNPPVVGVNVTDNVGIASLTSTHAPGEVFTVGSTTVTYTATDACGNEAETSFTVSVEDRELPVLHGLPANIVTAVLAGETSKVVTWTPATASDNCAVASLVTSHTPGTAFPIGTTSVTTTAIDTHGNATVQAFSVTVNGSLAVVAGNLGATTARDDGDWVLFTADTSGGCPPVTVECDPESGSFFPTGTTTVAVTATDACGTVATGSFEVTVTQEEVNRPPIARDDRPPDMTTWWIEVDVLANDDDPDGDWLTLVTIGMPPCGDAMPSGSDPNAIYFAAAACDAYKGKTISFDYEIEDAHGAQAQATVYVKIPDNINLPQAPHGG